MGFGRGTRGVRGQEDILQDQVSVALHDEALDVAALLRRVLPDGLAVLVDDNLAVRLHAELGLAVGAHELLVGVEPLVIAEGAGSFGDRHGEGEGCVVMVEWSLELVVLELKVGGRVL